MAPERATNTRARRPSGGRPTPRRIYSNSSVTSASSSGRESEGASNGVKSPDHTRQRSKASTLRLLEGLDEEDAFSDSGSTRGWMGQNIAESPQSGEESAFRFQTDSTSPQSSSRPLSPALKRRAPTPLATSLTPPTDGAQVGPPSPSKLRWDHLRQHVLPTARAATPPPPTSKSTLSTTTQPAPQPPRSQTPKPSRLHQRLALWGVVDQAREVAIDESRRFAEEVQRACWAARIAETPLKGAKLDQRQLILDTAGPNFFVPPSLSSTAASSTTTLPSTITSGPRKQELRRPQSQQSLSLGNRAIPSLKTLHHTLLQYASVNGPPQGEQINILPHELLVLSTLTLPMLTRDAGARIDEERWFAFESFETVLANWHASSIEAVVERCLWCCKAMQQPKMSLQQRALQILSQVLCSDKALQGAPPGAFQTLLQALYLLLPSLGSEPDCQAEFQAIKGLISKVLEGACGELDVEAIEKEYAAAFTREDDVHVITSVLGVDAFVNCLGGAPDSGRRWILQNLVDDYWPSASPFASFSPLQSTLYSHKIRTFSNFAISLISSKSQERTGLLDVEVVSRILHDRVITEASAVQGSWARRSRQDVSRVLFELLCAEKVPEAVHTATDVLLAWHFDGRSWKDSSEDALHEIIKNGDWPHTIRILSGVIKFLPEEMRKPLVAVTFPTFHEQLIEDPPPYPCLPLTHWLDAVSQLYPQAFFKCLFSCAAATKDTVVANHLWTVFMTSKFMHDFWTRDAEMMSVALMSGNQAKIVTPDGVAWGRPKLGQLVLLVELIIHAQAARKAADGSSDNSYMEAAKFFANIEARLTILIEAKEKSARLPLSQRLLFACLFLEIRLLTRSLKPSPWISRVISWLLESPIHFDFVDEIDLPAEVLLEPSNSLKDLAAVYALAKQGAHASHQRRSTVVLSPTVDTNFSTSDGTATQFEDLAEREQLITKLSSSLAQKVLELLVTVSGALAADDHRSLAPLLWNRAVDFIHDTQLVASSCFLVMQCAERIPKDFIAMVDHDFSSTDDIVRLKAIQKIAILSNWRFQILSQGTITDRTYRRPFKLARGPLPFVSTDIGSSLFVLEEDPDASKQALPLELRKRLSEIGWAADDKPSDPKDDWVRTPMSLLPSHHLDRLDIGADFAAPSSPTSSPSPSPQRQHPPSPKSPGNRDSRALGRKASTVSLAPGVKRRAVFVPSLASTLPCLAALVLDASVLVATLARETILDMMRNDPSLPTRPVFDQMSASEEDFEAAFTILRALLHIRRMLPPSMTYHVFNHVTGFLKYASRQPEASNPLRGFALSVPVLAKLVTQVSDMSVRELRRAKVDMFLIPTGALWFPPSAPSGPMFPRSLGPVANPFERVSNNLVLITMIRVSQNMLFLAMLKRHPQEVQLVRKNMPRLVLPSAEYEGDPPPLDLSDFVPRKPEVWRHVPFSVDSSLKGLSSLLSRSYLLLMAQIFRSMSRHLNDRSELAVLIDGLNRILLAHGHDIGIVSQSMIALMAASTRFRRLFTSGGGYTLFMPVVVKVYAESEAHSGIRHAIEYAATRFYALHQESFVFQTLDIMAHVMMVSDIEGDWVAKSVFALFSTLRRGVTPATPDAAGIRDSNKLQEREALLMTTAEEKPQTFLASLRRGGSQGKEQISVDLPEEYETRRLHIDNLLRLFLTVIAHEPTILRAEQFLRFLRYLTPYLYNAQNSARAVLRDGIDALCVVLTRAAAKAKIPEGSIIQPAGDFSVEVFNREAAFESNLLGKSKSPSDIAAMRLDYLSLVVAFTKAGGKLAPATHQKTIELVRAMLRDSTRDNSKRVSAFFGDYTKATLIRDGAMSLKESTVFIRDLAPIISVYSMTLDFSAVYETIAQLSLNPVYANDAQFSRVVVRLFCGTGLEACETAAESHLLFSLPARMSLISLVSRAVPLRGVDVMVEVEKRSPTYDFLAGVVLPLTLTLKTATEVVADGQWADAGSRDAYARTWSRLLAYVLDACRTSKTSGKDSSSRPERSRSRDKRRSVESGKAQMKATVTAIQILKIIVIRAEDDLSTSLPGVWPRIASFLKTLLTDGNATFAFGGSYDQSAPASPSQSPRTSLSSSQNHGVPPSPSFEMRGASLQSRPPPLRNPRVSDYSLWSLLELLHLFRTPLMVQMRLFIQEKMVLLDQDLKARLGFSHAGGRSRRVSTSSMFSKPRRRVSGYHSGVSSAEISPIASHSQSFPNGLPIPGAGGEIRQPGYARSPSSPGGGHDAGGPRIVHLGPVSQNGLGVRPILSQATSSFGTGFRLIPRTATVKSLKLVIRTYKRIRLVQLLMGYDPLLPIPRNDIHGGGGSVDEVDDDVGMGRMWTRRQALKAVVAETHDLMEEFDEGFREAEQEGMVVVDPDQSVTF